MWGNDEERERKRRILVAAWAYAYEIEAQPIVSDNIFDSEAQLIDKTKLTGNRKLDAFFSKHFEPHTGMWVHKHPDKEGLRRVISIMRKGNDMTKDKKFGIGEQSLLAKTILDALNEYTANLYDDGKRWHLGASLIGDNCARKLWYGFRWCYTATYVNARGENHKGRMMRLFNRGHKEETRFVEWLRGMGCEVREFQDGGNTQFRIKDVNGHYGGSLDGIIKLSAKFGDLPEMLLEFKTSSDKYFEKLKEDGVKVAKPLHFAQMSSYGERYKLTHALYMCVNKNTDEIYIEIVELDWSLSQKMTDKARNIIFSPVPPPKLSENSAYFECKFCDFAPVCHGQAPYEKNCRNCVNSSPVTNGEWSCKHYGIIPKEFIEQGADKCSMYQEAR